ncbi:MAG: hypothetical protein V7K53_30670 [Nostoc sp.]|uniref:hypothetical protein n=1 Tax=Nostoc sp. TaxID=1180 RepID=UPI002FF95159
MIYTGCIWSDRSFSSFCISSTLANIQFAFQSLLIEGLFLVKSDVYGLLRLRTYQISVRLCMTKPQAVISELRQKN